MYEGMGEICYIRGMFGHCEDACREAPSSGSELFENPWFGPWMKHQTLSPTLLKVANRDHRASRCHPPTRRVYLSLGAKVTVRMRSHFQTTSNNTTFVYDG